MGNKAISFACLLLPLSLAAQDSNTQLWFDGIGGLNFASYYTVETELSYQTLLNDTNGWSSFNVTPTLERAITPHWDLTLGLPLSYTIQDDDSRSEELRIQLGSRFLFTPFKRVQTRLLVRWEDRYQRDQESMDVTHTDRLRIRGEVAVPLDAQRWNADTMWYALADAEVFLTRSDVEERFANRTRFRIGLGRKFNYNWRVEFIYTVQQSRNTIADAERSIDHILRFRLKYFITPRGRKRPDAGGTGT